MKLLDHPYEFENASCFYTVQPEYLTALKRILFEHLEIDGSICGHELRYLGKVKFRRLSLNIGAFDINRRSQWKALQVMSSLPDLNNDVGITPLVAVIVRHVNVVVVVVVVGKRLVYISLAIRTRWRFLFVLSINTLSPFC